MLDAATRPPPTSQASMRPTLPLCLVLASASPPLAQTCDLLTGINQVGTPLSAITSESFVDAHG